MQPRTDIEKLIINTDEVTDLILAMIIHGAANFLTALADLFIKKNRDFYHKTHKGDKRCLVFSFQPVPH